MCNNLNVHYTTVIQSIILESDQDGETGLVWTKGLIKTVDMMFLSLFQPPFSLFN